MSSIALGHRLERVSSPLLLVVTVAASSAFLARAVTHVADEGIDRLGVARPAPAGPAPSVAGVATPPPVATDPGAALVARNMFCSTCTDDGPAPPRPPAAGPHALPRLIATHVVPGGGWATLLDPASGVGGAYPLGAVAPGSGGAVIAAIDRSSISVRLPDDSIVRLELASATEPDRVTAGGGAPPAGPPVAADPWADRVRAVGADRYEIDRRLIQELVGSGAGRQVKGVRIAPVTRDGALAGLRVSAARDGSVARALGLAPGDVIESIDGRPVTPDRLMELYGRIGELHRVELGVERTGARRTLGYDLR